ncbi:MAG: hypothetical protein ACWGHO_02125 [Candidatus Moraniibacteriota bacterium]
MNMEKMPMPIEKGEPKKTRREFMKDLGKFFVAASMPAIVGCVSEEEKTVEEVFNNKEYLDLEQEFIKEGFSDSKVFLEFKAIYGEKAFEEFKEKYKLSNEEADRRWSSSILRHGNTFLDRARNWKKVKEINKEAKSYEMVNGQVESINGIKVEEESVRKIEKDSAKSTGSKILESAPVDKNAY